MLLSFSAKRTNGQMGCHKRDNLKVKYSCIANNLMTVCMDRRHGPHAVFCLSYMLLT